MNADQAHAVADSLIAANRSSRENPKPLSRWEERVYGSRAFDALSAEVREELLARARRTALHGSVALGLSSAWMLLGFTVVMTLVSTYALAQFIPYILIVSLGAVAVQIRVVLVRMKLLELVSDRQSAAPPGS
jgi:hypothetical protein